MRVFVTGATGFIGTALVPELIGAGHLVLGLARSDAGAAALTAAGAEIHRGSIEDLDSLKSGAAAADAVIHLAFNHDFSRWAENSEADRRVIEAIGSVLAGSDKPFIVSSGTAAAHTPGRLTTEEDPPNSPIPRVASEHAADAAAAKGARVMVMRLAQIHDPVKQGLITPLVAIALEKGVSAYVGDGGNCWPAAHVSDVAHLYRLALEKGVAGARYNAVAEEGVPMRKIAEAIGRGLKMPAVSITPEEAEAHFGWLGQLAGFDIPASSALTQERLGWHPTGPGLISDLERMRYVES
jgi:nucleoside-diphosphate-sugar epimerase